MGKAVAGRTITFFDGDWHDGSPQTLSVRDHGVWLGSTVFDGARAFAGMTPDLGRHCARVVTSAKILGLEPTLSGPEIESLVWEGLRRFDADDELYISPLYWGTDGFIMPDPAGTRFALVIFQSPLPSVEGFTACRSTYRRPARDMAPTEAKASCLYPNVARIVRQANEKGFDTAVVFDPNSNVAEFAYTNLFFARGNTVFTPAINGTFLNGITRQRVISLLRDSGHEVVEKAIDYDELTAADEIFATGNYAKVYPCRKLDGRDLPAGPVFHKARDLYWEFARHSNNK